jgi:hypothetical protein
MEKSQEFDVSEISSKGIPTISIMVRALILSLFLEIVIYIANKEIILDFSKYIYQIIDILSYVMIIYLVFIYLKKKRVDIVSTFKLKKLNLKIIALILLISIGLLLIEGGLNLLTSKFISDKLENQLAAQLSPHTIQDWIYFLFSIVILGPLFEELIFRGLMQSSINSRYGFWPSIYVTAILFGSTHFLPLLILKITFLGIIYGLLVHRTKSILGSIIPHCFNNFFTGLVQYLALQAHTPQVVPESGYIVIIVLISIGGLFLLFGFKRLSLAKL